jgi:hypothetical protein
MLTSFSGIIDLLKFKSEGEEDLKAGKSSQFVSNVTPISEIVSMSIT